MEPTCCCLWAVTACAVVHSGLFIWLTTLAYCESEYCASRKAFLQAALHQAALPRSSSCCNCLLASIMVSKTTPELSDLHSKYNLNVCRGFCSPNWRKGLPLLE